MTCDLIHSICNLYIRLAGLLCRMGRSRSPSPATNYRGTYRVSKQKKAKGGKRRRRKKGGNEGDDEGYGGGDKGNNVHNYDIEVGENSFVIISQQGDHDGLGLYFVDCHSGVPPVCPFAMSSLPNFHLLQQNWADMRNKPNQSQRNIINVKPSWSPCIMFVLIGG